ncbi:hypothetical protein [Thiomonas sp.]
MPVFALRLSAIVCDSCDCGERIRCKLLILLALVFLVGFAIDAIGEEKTMQEGGHLSGFPTSCWLGVGFAVDFSHERNSCGWSQCAHHAFTMGRKALSVLTMAVHHAVIMAFAFAPAWAAVAGDGVCFWDGCP